MTSKQVNEENSIKVDNTYKMLKKYVAVRQIIHTLGVSVRKTTGLLLGTPDPQMQIFLL